MPDIEQMSDSELAGYQAGYKAGSRRYILVEREWERRRRAADLAAEAARRTRFDKAVDWFKDNPVLSFVMLFVLAVTSIAGFISIVQDVVQHFR